jgi:hypothetical protein
MKVHIVCLVRDGKAMKTMILSACACFAVALLCFGFLWWNSGTITYDPVQVVKVTPCQYRQSPTGRLLPGTEITYQSLSTDRLYGPTLCASGTLHDHVGEEVALIGSTIPGYLSPPTDILTFIRYVGVIALAAGIWLIGRLWRAARKPKSRKGESAQSGSISD